MSTAPSTLAELAKYPLAVLSIFLALVGAKYVLGIPFGTVSEITKDGVKFSQDAKGEIASLAAQVNASAKAIEELKAQLPARPLSVEAKADIFEASQTVSNQTADLADVRPERAVPGPEVRGYIWIGDYDSAAGRWRRIKLVSPSTNTAFAGAPAAMAAGAEYIVSGNMVLRDGLPQDDAAYFQGRKSLGIVASGTKVRVLAPPTGIERESALQYWMQVAVAR